MRTATPANHRARNLKNRLPPARPDPPVPDVRLPLPDFDVLQSKIGKVVVAYGARHSHDFDYFMLSAG
jgi:hypothetical protein